MTSAPNAKDIADYAASQLLALKGMAESHDLEMLAWLLEMAVLQALRDAGKEEV